MEKIELPEMRWPVPPLTRIPLAPLKAITFGGAPTMKTYDTGSDPLSSRPSFVFPSGSTPFDCVPIKLPITVVRPERAPLMKIPSSPLPEMTFPAVEVDPPIVFVPAF